MTTTITARTPEDLLALVPVLLGFEPEESIVLLTLDGTTTFHARIDLPGGRGEHLDQVARQLAGPAVHHRIRRVVIVIYSGREADTRRAARVLKRTFRREHIRVVDMLRVHEGRWFSLVSRADVPAHGVPFDVSTHPFRVEAIAAGEVVASSRDELAARLCRDERAAGAVERALCDLAESEQEVLAMTGPELRELLDRHARTGDVPDDLTTARILAALLRPGMRDHAWVGLTAPESVDHLRLWCELVRRAPEPLAAPPAAILAAVAWVSGRGALAWCAVDRCREEDEHHPLANLVSDLLAGAVPPPRAWPDSVLRLVGWAEPGGRGQPPPDDLGLVSRVEAWGPQAWGLGDGGCDPGQ